MILPPWKVLFEPKKHIFEQNSLLLALNKPHWSRKMVSCSQNKLITWDFCFTLAILTWNALFWPRKCSLVSKRADFYQNQPFLIFLCFTIKTYFAINSYFWPRKVPVGLKRFINPKKGPFWALKAHFWPK